MPEAAPVAPPPAAPPAPAKQINVSEMPKPVTPATPPKPGSARERMRQEVEKKFGVTETPPPAQRTDPKTGATPEKPAAAEVPPTPAAAAPAAETPPVKPAEAPVGDKKQSPWKLVDQFKERAVKAEQRILEMEKELGPETERQARMQRFNAQEKRLKELEDEIRYVNYAKSKDFQDQYQKPYEEQWARSMAELREITLEDPQTRQQRPVNDQDLIELVNLPLGRARELADKVFGPFADDVMAHRKAVRELFEKQHSALEKAKTEGATRDRDLREKYQRFQQQLTSTVKETWDQVNATIIQDAETGAFFKPKEGNNDWNDRLEKGFKLVDQAFAENPMDPRLNNEQRSEIIKRHAAVRNRAAGWGALRHENSVLSKRVAELEKDLKAYKDTTPHPTESAPRATVVVGGKARDQVMAELQRRAKPA